MSRDELAFAILLKIMEVDDLRHSVINGDVQEAMEKNRLPNAAAAFARVAFRQADEFIAAGAPTRDVETVAV